MYKKGTESYNFVRYNDPVKLIQPDHRTGRCGEFANAFAFLASVMGFEVRKVSTVYEDHVWVEIYSVAQKRWIHYDPCENQHDMPLVYELGWKKEMSYVVAVQADLVSDVSKKYSVQHQKLALNQATKVIRYDEYMSILKRINLQLKQKYNLSTERVNELKARRVVENAEMKHNSTLTPESVGKSYSGRQNADEEWLKNRGEFHPETVKSPGKYLHVGTKLTYNSAKDKICIDDEICFTGFLSHALKYKQVFRKVESDWEKAYISRVEDAAHGWVKLAIKFKSPAKSLTVRKILTFEKEAGKVAIALATDTEIINLRNSTTHKFKNPVTECGIYFHFYGESESDVSWQHSQVFRQDLKDDNPAFAIDFTPAPEEKNYHVLNSKSEIDQHLKNHPEKLTVIDFFATWCPPCRAIAPVFERLATENKTVQFIKTDVDQNPDSSQFYGIRAMPTFLFLKNGQVLETVRGANESAIINAINKHK